MADFVIEVFGDFEVCTGMKEAINSFLGGKSYKERCKIVPIGPDWHWYSAKLFCYVDINQETEESRINVAVMKEISLMLKMIVNRLEVFQCVETYKKK